MREIINCLETLQKAEGLNSSSKIFLSHLDFVSVFIFLYRFVYDVKTKAFKYKEITSPTEKSYSQKGFIFPLDVIIFFSKTTDIIILISRLCNLKQWLLST